MSFPVLFRGAVHVFSEHAVEIADIAVAAAGGDGAYGLGAGEKLVAGRADAVVIDVFDEGHVDLGFEKTAELPELVQRRLSSCTGKHELFSDSIIVSQFSF